MAQGCRFVLATAFYPVNSQSAVVQPSSGLALMQRGLIASPDAVGAAHIRFIFGLPFAILFLGLARLATGTPVTLARNRLLLGPRSARRRSSSRPR